MVSFIKKKTSKVFRKKVKRQRRLSVLQFQILVGVCISIVLSLIVTGIWYGTRIESLQIQHVQVIGGQTIPHSAIEDIVQSELSGSYLKLIPRHFIPLYPKEIILQDIKKLDRVKNVQVELSDAHTLTVVFDEYVPYALWCEKKDSETCLFIDVTGFAFAQAPTLQGNALVRYVEDGKVPQPDTTAFDADFINTTRAFIDLLKDQLDLYVTHVSKAGKYDIEYTISGGGILKISQTMSMEDSFANLKTILNSDEFKNISPGSFQYIDLRFGDKIFVNEHKATTTQDTTTATSSN